MRERILGLPLMLAAVLTLVWRQVPTCVQALCARELNRMLARENLLWAKVTKISQQSLSQRLLTFPAELFEKVLTELLVTLNQRWSQREKRPLPLSVAHANQYFEQLWIVDASTLEALCGIYHFTQALNQGTATNIIAYLTAPENQDLGIVKSPRPKRTRIPLDLSPSPA